MTRFLAIVAALAVLLPIGGPAAAQNDRSMPLSEMLRQLQRDARYSGRIVGTHTLRAHNGASAYLYEVRILSPQDRVIIVYLDPRTGAVVRNPDAWLRRTGRR